MKEMKRILITLLLILIICPAIKAQQLDRYTFRFECIKDALTPEGDEQPCNITVALTDTKGMVPILFMKNRENGEQQTEKMLNVVITDHEDILHFPTADNTSIYSIGMMNVSGKMQLRLIIKKSEDNGIPQPVVILFNKEGSSNDKTSNLSFKQLLRNTYAKRLNCYEVNLFYDQSPDERQVQNSQNQINNSGSALENSYVQTPTDIGNGTTAGSNYTPSTTESNSSYSNSTSSERRCEHCHGSGRCNTCNGNYTHYIGYVGAKPKHCPNCSNGSCRWCNGTGKR